MDFPISLASSSAESRPVTSLTSYPYRDPFFSAVAAILFLRFFDQGTGHSIESRVDRAHLMNDEDTCAFERTSPPPVDGR